MLVRLLYVSRAAEPPSAEATQSILSSSRAFNTINGITGILCYGGGMYLQAIEGGRKQINTLYTQILRDPRHVDVVLLHYEEIVERRFGSWTMGQVNLSKINASTILRYSETIDLDPYAMSGKVTLALLEDLIMTASIIGRA